MKKKNILKSLSILSVAFSMILSLLGTTQALSTDSLIYLVDSETKETIKNADVEIAILSKDEIINCESNNQGILSLNSSEVEKLSNESLYVSVKGSYTGEIFTSIDNNTIFVNRTLTRGATDWNTISTESLGWVWIPLTRLPTTDGLTTTFTLGESSSFSISGGGFSAVSFSYVTGTAIEKSIDSTDDKYTSGDRWMYIFGYVIKYKVVQQTTTGQTRTIYGVGNNIKSLDKRIKTTTFSSLNDATATYIFQKGSSGSYSIKRTTTTSFTLTSDLATDYGSITSSFGGSNSNSSACKHTSNGKYKVYVAYNYVYSV